jgi:hypothetical protein
MVSTRSRLTGEDPGSIVEDDGSQRFRIVFLEAFDDEFNRREILKIIS